MVLNIELELFKIHFWSITNVQNKLNNKEKHILCISIFWYKTCLGIHKSREQLHTILQIFFPIPILQFITVKQNVEKSFSNSKFYLIFVKKKIYIYI